MTEENTAVRPRRVGRTILKTLALGFALVVVLLVVAHFAWKYSGSGQWKLEREKNGIKVYSMKIPGRTLKDWKAVRRLKTTLNGAVAAMATTTTEDCAEFNANCVSVQSVKDWNPRDLTSVHLYRANAPKPFLPRELLISTHASQNPQNKAVLIEFLARPDDLPRHDCCLRITEYRNSWRFTPLGNGETEAELVVHMDQGVPYPLMNRISPNVLIKMFGHIPAYFAKPKWQQAKFDSIKEL